MFTPKTKKELLERWIQRLTILERCHFEATVPLARLNLGLGIPVVILSTIVGTTVFATLEKSIDDTIKIAVALTSVTAAVLSSLQTFLRFSENVEKHKASAFKAGSIRREIELILVAKDIETIPDDKISSLREQIEQITASELTIPNRIYIKVKKRFKIDESVA